MVLVIPDYSRPPCLRLEEEMLLESRFFSDYLSHGKQIPSHVLAQGPDNSVRENKNKTRHYHQIKISLSTQSYSLLHKVLN